jgi:hypothetical protein
MVEFQRTINSSEVRYAYLNLTDDSGRTFGSLLPPHKTRLAVVDGEGRRTNGSKHHDNQVWGNLRAWYEANGVGPGTRVSVRFDIADRAEDGLHVLHLEVLGAPPVSTMTFGPSAAQPALVQPDLPEQATELPISLERQLEDFLASNLSMLEAGLRLYRSDDGREGRQYPTDVGVIDLLCIRPNGDFLVVELKRGRSSDSVVGQVSRYMGWVARHIASGKTVRGLILTYERDDSLRYAVFAHDNLELRRFKLRLEIVADDQP